MKKGVMVREIGNELHIVILDKGFELLIFVLQECDFYNGEPDPTSKEATKATRQKLMVIRIKSRKGRKR